MAVYTLEGPDGKKYKVEGPNGATAEQLGSFIMEQYSDKQVKNMAQQRADEKKYAPNQGMSDFDQLKAGAGKAISNTGTGIAQMFGFGNRQDVADMRKRDEPLMDSSGGTVGNIAGNVGMALAPGGVTLGAGKVLSKVLPNSARLAEALMAAGKGIMAPKGIPQAVGVGAAQGAVQPSASSLETLQNMGMGAAGSALVPTAVRAGQVGKAAVEPFYEGGQNKIIGRALGEATGGQADDTIKALRAAAPLIPGSLPTAGQAGANPGLAALERTATATDPVAMNQLFQRTTAQNEARIAALNGVSPDRAGAVAARSAATEPLYKQAYGQTIEQTPELAALMQRPSMQSALGRGQSLAQEQGQGMSLNKGSPPIPSQILDASGNPMSVTPGVAPTMTGRDAHLMKMGLDDMANASPMSGIGGNELRAIQGTRGDFLGEVEKQVPSYGQARQAYADLSRPVNQADIASEIATKSTNFRGDITPAAYSRALRDETAQSVTGQSNATLAKSMEPDQMATLNAIQDDLGRADFAQTAGKGGGSDTVQKLAYSNLMAKSGLPNWAKDIPGAGVVGRMADLGYKRSNDEMRQKLAQALLDPAATADLLEAGMVTPKIQALVEGLRRGGAGVGAASPYLLNAATLNSGQQ